MSDGNNHREAFEQTRRSFIGTSALGFGLGGDGSSVFSTADSEQGNGPPAPKQHDHSGHFDTATNLGEHAPVESITVDDLKSKNTPFVDVTAYGVVGDGDTDDAEAFQEAVDAATPHGVLYVPHDVTLHFEDSIDIDLENPPLPDNPGQNRFAFICHGTLNPAPGLGDAIHIHNGRFPYVYAQVDGGGEDVETDNAIRITAMEGGLFEGTASYYDGTFFKVDNGSYITTLVSIGYVRTQYCGQSIHMNIGEGSTHPGLYGLGEIQDVWDHSPVRCPEFRGVYDLCINQYENVVRAGRTERGLVFDQCASLWFDKIAVGGNAEIPLVEFNSVDGCHVSSLFATHAHGPGVVMRDVTNGSFTITALDTDVGLDYGGDSGNNRIEINARDNRDGGITVHEEVSGHLHLAGNGLNNGGPGLTVETTEAPVYVDGFQATGNTESDIDVPRAANAVRISNAEYQTLTGRPRAINGFGTSAREGKKPDARNWQVGDRVLFTDTEDGSGDGLYLLASPETWRRYDIGEEVDTGVDYVQTLASQGNPNNVPGQLSEGGSFGQSFTVGESVSELEFLPANYNEPETAVTMTLYRGSPQEGSLSEVDSVDIDSLANTETTSLPFETETGGTYYLEMTFGEGTPTWWWHAGDDGLADVGGTAFVNREAQSDTNFVFTVRG